MMQLGGSRPGSASYITVEVAWSLRPLGAAPKRPRLSSLGRKTVLMFLQKGLKKQGISDIRVITHQDQALAGLLNVATALSEIHL